MGIIFLFVLAVAGAIGAVIGGIIGFGIGIAYTGTPSFIYTFFGIVAGGFFGLFVGLIVVVRALQDYWKPQDRHDGPERSNE
jgi:hypothetical protein